MVGARTPEVCCEKSLLETTAGTRHDSGNISGHVNMERKKFHRVPPLDKELKAMLVATLLERENGLVLGMSPLMVVQRRVVSPENIHTQTIHMDSSGCSHMLVHTHSNTEKDTYTYTDAHTYMYLIYYIHRCITC